MPYNGSGTYSLSDTIAPSTPGDALEVQAILDDIAGALNVAFCRDGQASMSGALKLAVGTLAAPSLSFASDVGVGFYRQAAGTMAAVAGGNEIMRISSTGLDLRSALSVNGTAGLDTANIRDSAVTTAKLNDNAVSDAKLRDSAALSVIGRSANSVGDPGDIAAGTDGHVLRRSGTTLGFGTIGYGSFDSAVTATQSDMEAASATDKIVTPGRVHFHPGVAKAWVRWETSGTSISASYGVSSVTNNGTGDEVVNFSTAFSSATSYSIYATASQADPGNLGNTVGPRATDIAATSCRFFIRQSSSAVDATLSCAFFGDI